MVTAKEHRTVLERELLKVGIKPDIQVTGSGHLQIQFRVNGNQKSVLTASTPSDRRATLNARSDIRRILRLEGVYKKVAERAKKNGATILDRAFAIPLLEPALIDRVKQLEENNTAMLDMLMELLDKVSNAAAPAPPIQDSVKTTKSRNKNTRSDQVLYELVAGPVSVKDLITRLGWNKNRVNAELTRLKKKGLVTNPSRGVWTKIVQLSDGTTIVRTC